MLSFDFTGRQRDDPAFSRLAVKAERSQLGIVGMGRDHHHTLLAIVRLAKAPQRRLPLYPAKTPAQFELARGQGFGGAGQVQITPPSDAALEGLPVRALQAQQVHRRVEETPQPGTFQLNADDQGFIRRQLRIQQQPARLQAQAGLFAAGRERVLIAVFGRVKQVIGKPGFMGGPQQHRKDQRQPPGDQYAGGDQHQHADQ